jgi:diguanylate cyclase (GGDEF)-like protein/PAS domain S-box-containing protein
VKCQKTRYEIRFTRRAFFKGGKWRKVLKMKTPDRQEKRDPYVLIVVFVVLAAGILAAGYAYYRNYEQNYRVGVEHQLSAIADLKASELEQWRRERLGDAALFLNNAPFSSLVRRFFDNTGDIDAREQIRTWLNHVQTSYRYDRVMLLDVRYRKRIIVPEGPERSASYVSPATSEALRSGRVAFEDFYWNEENRRIYLKVLAPVFAGGKGGPLIGVVALRVDPERYLYPFIGRWPTPSRTAETLLVRREGNEALFLNELRFQKNSALKLRVPLDKIERPAVKAVLGREGIVEGPDYRRVHSIAAIRAIPDSPWLMEARIDSAEVYGPLKERLWFIVVLVVALLIGAGTGVGLIWRHQRGRFYEEKVSAAEALSESEERYRIAIEGSIDGVAIVQNQVHVYANQPFLRMFGYERVEEILDKRSYFTVHPDDRDRVRDYSLMRERGEQAPTQYEFKGIRRDGTSLQVEVSVNTIAYQGRPAILAYFRDITAKKQHEERILAEQSRYANLLESSPFGLAVVTAEGLFSYVNPQFQALLGYDHADVPDGQTWFRKAYPDPEYRKKMIGAWVEDTGSAAQGERISRLLAVTCKDGTKRIVNIITVKLESGEHLLTFEDRTELHKYQQDLEYLAVHDLLTGLLNRRSLEEMLTRAIARAKRGAASSLLYMDLDNFKDVNDTVGHSAGDEVLITMADLAKKTFRTEDILFRLGGDEFAALLEGIRSRDALPAAERLRSIVDAHRFELEGQVFHLSLSVGLIEIDGSLQPGELLSKADAAMYRAKEQGKNVVVLAA